MSRKGLNGDVVVETAAKLTEREGYGAVSMHALADELGVKTASLYNHVKNQDDLRVRLGEYALDKLDICLHTALDKQNTNNPQDVLATIGKEYYVFAHTYPQLYQAIIDVPTIDNDELTSHAKTFTDVMFHQFKQLGYTDDNALNLCRAMRAVMHGFVTLEAAGFFATGINSRTSYHAILTQFIKTAARKG